MINEFLETIDTEDYFSTGFLNFCSVKMDGHGSTLEVVIRIQFAILSEPGIEMTQFWQINCLQAQKYVISTDPSIHDQIKLSDKHCLLWDYSQPQKSLLISTGKESSTGMKILVGHLWLKHQALAEQWIPFEISQKVLKNGEGVLAKGSEKVINAYQKVLDEAGIQCSSYVSALPKWFERGGRGWIEEPQSFQALIIGDSYVVASEINAKKLSECTPTW